MDNNPSSELYRLRASEDDMAFLRGEWLDLLTRHGADEARATRLFGGVAEHYSEGGRFYHNLRHVAELLRLLAGFAAGVGDYDAVRFATWFHDVIYDTRRDDNEERSAEFAARTLRELGVPAPTAGRVREMILATKGHAAEGLARDAQLFLDADLSILGAPPEVYGRYSEAIRTEYAWVPAPAYRQGRRKVLEGFLGRGRIYHTVEMFARFEERARANLRRELELL